MVQRAWFALHQNLHSLGLRGQLLLIFFLSCGAALSTVFIGMSLFSFRVLHESFEQDSIAVAEVVGGVSRASLAFRDQVAAARTLGAVSENSSVSYVALVLPSGETLSHFGDSSLESLIPMANELSAKDAPLAPLGGLSAQWVKDYFVVNVPVMLNGEAVGSLLLITHSTQIYERFKGAIVILLTVVTIASGIALIFSWRLQRAISDPILALSEAACRVARSQDYSVRLVAEGANEVSSLVQHFNKMLGTIERVHQELTEAKLRAERADEAKSRFLANMSHEIRTPLHAILGMCSELLSSKHLPGQREFLESIHTAASSLLAILGDILDYAKIEANRLAIHAVPCDLQQCVNQVVQLFWLQAHEKEIKMTTELSPDLPTRLLIDQVRLRQVLINLLSNALKFTPTGGKVHITANLRSREEHRLQLHFSVRDTGVGIPASKLDKLFQPFSQLDTSPTRVTGGSGLGLSISHRIVGLMGGWMWVESQEGQGADFQFVIQSEEVSEDTHTTLVSAEHLGAGLRGVSQLGNSQTILVVDDNKVNQTLARRVLEKKGFQVIVAAHGKEALAVLENHQVDLVLLDLDMPVMDGFDTIRTIRESKHFPFCTIPIVVYTASLTAGDFGICEALGANGVIQKPIPTNQLIAVINEHLLRAEKIKIGDSYPCP